jgi:predicted amidohydrolase YtcJ
VTTLVVDRIHGHPGATAIRIEGDRIASIGAPDGARVAVGGTVLPGMRDAHIHPLGIAAAADQIDLSAASSLSEIGELLGRQAAEMPPGEPIIAIRLDDTRLDGEMPTRWDLDKFIADRPVMVYRHCSHIASANSLALASASVGDQQADPANGRFRRRAGGAITGVLEEGAVGLVSSHLTSLITPPDVGSVQSILGQLVSRGIVAIDAMISVGASMWCVGGDELDVISQTDSPIAVDVYVIADTPASLRAAKDLLDRSPGNIRFAGWKGFADGSLGGRTAALRSPYSDNPSTSGLDLGAGLYEMAAAAVDLGGKAAIHAIGDLALDRVLEIAERLGPGIVRVEHASVADPDPIARMASAGVIASVQPSFATSDAAWVEQRLGPDRAAWAYAFASMLEAGVALRGGSDAPIESADPFVGITDACRPRPESLELDEAISMYTAAPLAVGGPATFVICEEDPAEAPQVAGVGVREVWIDGERTPILSRHDF